MIRRLLGYTHHEVANIFHVTPPPRDLDAAHVLPVLLLCHDDLDYGDHRRAVLVDVELHGDQFDSIIETDRYSALLPQVVHRRQLLRYAGVAGYCEMQQSRCLLWVRGEIIPLQSTNTVTLHHGDYVRIAVPPFETPTVPTHFAIRACQAGYGREKIIHHFRQRGADEDSLYTAIEAGQQEQQSPEAQDDTTALWQTLNSIVPACTLKIDGPAQNPIIFERSAPGFFPHGE